MATKREYKILKQQRKRFPGFLIPLSYFQNMFLAQRAYMVYTYRVFVYISLFTIIYLIIVKKHNKYDNNKY